MLLEFFVNFISCRVSCFLDLLGDLDLVEERTFFVGEAFDCEDFLGVVGLDLTFFFGLPDRGLASSDRMISISSVCPFWKDARENNP